MSPTSRLSIERQEKVFGLNLSYFMKLCFLGRIGLRAKAVVTRIPESNHRRVVLSNNELAKLPGEKDWLRKSWTCMDSVFWTSLTTFDCAYPVRKSRGGWGAPA